VKTYKTKKFGLTILALTLIIVGLVTTYSYTAFASINILNEEKIKVFVGCLDDTNSLNKNLFINDRQKMISNLAEKTPKDVSKVLITFDKYVSADEAEEILNIDENNIVIDEIFISIPNQTGRAIIVASGAKNIEQTIYSELDTMIANENDDEIIQAHEKMKKEYGIFAISFDTDNSTIYKISENETVKFADLFNYPKAENESGKTGKSITYIALPEKPDGTF